MRVWHNTSVQPWHPRLRCLPVFLGARLTPVNPVHPRPFSAGNTHSGHKTTSCFYPSVNNRWGSHKNVSDNAKDGVEKRKGIALSAGPDISNHTRKLKLMMSWRLKRVAVLFVASRGSRGSIIIVSVCLCNWELGLLQSLAPWWSDQGHQAPRRPQNCIPGREVSRRS